MTSKEKEKHYEEYDKKGFYSDMYAEMNLDVDEISFEVKKK